MFQANWFLKSFHQTHGKHALVEEASNKPAQGGSQQVQPGFKHQLISSFKPRQQQNWHRRDLPEVFELPSNNIGAESASRVHAREREREQLNELWNISEWQLSTVNNPPCSRQWNGKEMARSDGKSNSERCGALNSVRGIFCGYGSFQNVDTFTLAALFSSAAAPKTTMTRTKDMKNSIPKPCIWCEQFARRWESSHLKERDIDTKLSRTKTALTSCVIRHQALEKGGTQLKWNRKDFLIQQFLTKPPRLCATT